jgi:hypothetical protein
MASGYYPVFYLHLVPFSCIIHLLVFILQIIAWFQLALQSHEQPRAHDRINYNPKGQRTGSMNQTSKHTLLDIFLIETNAHAR